MKTFVIRLAENVTRLSTRFSLTQGSNREIQRVFLIESISKALAVFFRIDESKSPCQKDFLEEGK